MTTSLLKRTDEIRGKTNAEIEASNLKKLAEMPKGSIANFTYDHDTGYIFEFTDVVALQEDDFSDACYNKAGNHITELEGRDISPRAMFNLKNTMDSWNARH